MSTIHEYYSEIPNNDKKMIRTPCLPGIIVLIIILRSWCTSFVYNVGKWTTTGWCPLLATLVHDHGGRRRDGEIDINVLMTKYEPWLLYKIPKCLYIVEFHASLLSNYRRWKEIVKRKNKYLLIFQTCEAMKEHEN